MGVDSSTFALEREIADLRQRLAEAERNARQAASERDEAMGRPGAMMALATRVRHNHADTFVVESPIGGVVVTIKQLAAAGIPARPDYLTVQAAEELAQMRLDVATMRLRAEIAEASATHWRYLAQALQGSRFSIPRAIARYVLGRR